MQKPQGVPAALEQPKPRLGPILPTDRHLPALILIRRDQLEQRERPADRVRPGASSYTRLQAVHELLRLEQHGDMPPLFFLSVAIGSAPHPYEVDTAGYDR